MAKNCTDSDGDLFDSWNPIRFLPESITQRYGNPQISEPECEGVCDSLGGSEVYPTRDHYFLFQVDFDGCGELTLFYRYPVKATQLYVDFKMGEFMQASRAVECEEFEVD